MWKISYRGSTFPFGAVQVERVEVGGVAYRVDDTDLPRSDGMLFGQDFATPGDIQVQLVIDAGAIPEDAARRKFVLDAATQFSRTWDAEVLRASPSEVAELYAGELGMFEGRPRSVEWDWDNYAPGFLRGKARFVRASMQSYVADSAGNVAWQTHSVGLVPSLSGGFVAPLIFPLSTAIDSDRSLPFTVGGMAPAWPIITVKGPINAGCTVELVGRWSVKVNRALKYDETAEIDCRPGRQMSRVNNKPINVLDPMVDFTQLYMNPGPQELGLRGTSMEGTATATLRWRETRGAI